MLLEEVLIGMTNRDFDLIIIGAGANGSSIAYEAARHGLQVALLEAGDIGEGTSSRSTKLLHGGVRYLELAFKTFDFSQLNLVKEALIEREYWLTQMPFLARRINIVLPTENFIDQSYYRIGLGFYDTLAQGIKAARSRFISKEELNATLPFLRKSLTGGVAYSDGQFDDARLNLLLALTAEKAGAVIRTRCRVVDLKLDNNGKACEVISEDLNGNQERWLSKAIVNATGIDADSLRHIVDKNTSKRILISRGVHLVLKNDLCPEEVGLLIPKTDDGRVLFALPFHGHTLIGTTDSPCEAADAFTSSKHEEKYLLNHVNYWFPNQTDLRISSSWAGGRPLLNPIGGKVKSSRVVREHEIEILPCGLISSMGGKWTTCRQIALDTLKAVEKVLGQKLPKAKPLRIIGAHDNPIKTFASLTKQRNELRSLLPSNSIIEKQINHLQSNYGLEALSLIAKSAEKDRAPISDVIPICRAEISHAIKNEHAKTPTDILARRCRIAMVCKKEAERLIPEINMILTKEIGTKEFNSNLETFRD